MPPTNRTNRQSAAYAERDGTLAAALNRSIVLTALQAIEQAWETEFGKR